MKLLMEQAGVHNKGICKLLQTTEQHHCRLEQDQYTLHNTGHAACASAPAPAGKERLTPGWADMAGGGLGANGCASIGTTGAIGAPYIAQFTVSRGWYNTDTAHIALYRSVQLVNQSQPVAKHCLTSHHLHHLLFTVSSVRGIHHIYSEHHDLMPCLDGADQAEYII